MSIPICLGSEDKVGMKEGRLFLLSLLISLREREAINDSSNCDFPEFFTSATKTVTELKTSISAGAWPKPTGRVFFLPLVSFLFSSCLSLFWLINVSSDGKEGKGSVFKPFDIRQVSASTSFPLSTTGDGSDSIGDRRLEEDKIEEEFFLSGEFIV